MERDEHRRIDHQLLLEEQRLENARSAIANGTRDKQERVVCDLRRHYKKMSRGFARRNDGKRSENGIRGQNTS